METLPITTLQEIILQSDRSLLNVNIDRHEILPETGNWHIINDYPFEYEIGGEALVFKNIQRNEERFPCILPEKIAVRIQPFDPFFLTKKSEDIMWTINLMTGNTVFENLEKYDHYDHFYPAKNIFFYFSFSNC